MDKFNCSVRILGRIDGSPEYQIYYKEAFDWYDISISSAAIADFPCGQGPCFVSEDKRNADYSDLHANVHGRICS